MIAPSLRGVLFSPLVSLIQESKEKEERNCTGQSEPNVPKTFSRFHLNVGKKIGRVRRGNPKKPEPGWKEQYGPQGMLRLWAFSSRETARTTTSRSEGILDYFNREITQPRVQPGGSWGKSGKGRKRGRAWHDMWVLKIEHPKQA